MLKFCIILNFILSTLFCYKWHYWKKQYENIKYLADIYENKIYELERKRKQYYGK